MKLGRQALTLVLRAAMWLFMRVRVEGAEQVPSEGPVIIIYNHITFLDPVVLTGALARESTAMSKVESFSTPVLGLILRIFGAFPVQRGRVDRWALRYSLSVLEQGGVLLIAPEGTRSGTPGLQEGKDGLAYLALRSGVPVVPAGISGAEEVVGNLRRGRRTPVCITFGRPFRLVAEDGRVRRPEM
ncbi:MAG: 1-acyl-sn-glycerol-3-phosphate acyltransferase, partial [Chloroflexi bacterium]|nr:1-acyl-sn-glycerol-3-phosphate acyltransferase [Chloroflexota bacterium]